VVIVQEMRFPLGARQRVKNELRHLHPEYHCFLEAGKDPLPSHGEGIDTKRQKSPWYNRGLFAVATFLHRGVFRTAQRREWHVDADTRTLRHMTRRRVLRVDAELHDGQRLQVFNMHQATSGDLQPQQHTWQILTKSIMECRHQRILLGGDPECERQWSQSQVRGVQRRAYEAGGRVAHQIRWTSCSPN
jgi:endonuclease/exonuclease/phosphatase family metal-dependent hydrolase